MILYCVIKHLATCPECSAQVGVDAATGRLLFTPEGGESTVRGETNSARPCPHLACMWASLAASWTRPDGSSSADNGHSREWIWESGRGLYPADSNGNPDHLALVFYLTDYFFRSLPAKLRPASKHTFVGASAMFRDQAAPGSGEFLLARDGDALLHATLDGYAVFARDPQAVMQEIAARSKGYIGRGPALNKWPVVSGLAASGVPA